MTTASENNLFVQNGQLYIHPTLTSEEIGNDAIFNGGSYKLDVRIYTLLIITGPHMTFPGLYKLNFIRVFHQFGLRPQNRHTPCTERAY